MSERVPRDVFPFLFFSPHCLLSNGCWHGIRQILHALTDAATPLERPVLSSNTATNELMLKALSMHREPDDANPSPTSLWL